MTDRKYDAILIETLDDIETPSMKFYNIEIKDLIDKETNELTRMMGFSYSFKFRNKQFSKHMNTSYLHIFNIYKMHDMMYNIIGMTIYNSDYNLLKKKSKLAKKCFLKVYGIK